MNTQTIIQAIDNLPGEARQRLMTQISGLIVEALADKHANAPRQRSEGRGSNGRGRTRSAGKATEEEVLAHIKTNPGQRTEQIAAALGSNVKAALKKLRAAKSIRTQGQKRAMTYSVAGRR